MGHPPHEVFFMIKLKLKKNGEELVNKLNQTTDVILEMLKGMAPEMEELLNGIKVYAKEGKGYLYLIVEMDNPLADGIIEFASKVTSHQHRFWNPSLQNAPSNSKPKFLPISATSSAKTSTIVRAEEKFCWNSTLIMSR